MEREHHVKKSETEKHLHYAVLDNLILSYTGIGAKGSKAGQEYEGFRIPDTDEMSIVSISLILDCLLSGKLQWPLYKECVAQDIKASQKCKGFWISEHDEI